MDWSLKQWSLAKASIVLVGRDWTGDKANWHELTHSGDIDSRSASFGNSCLYSYILLSFFFTGVVSVYKVVYKPHIDAQLHIYLLQQQIIRRSVECRCNLLVVFTLVILHITIILIQPESLHETIGVQFHSYNHFS